MRIVVPLAALVLLASTAAAQHQHGKSSAPEPFTASPAFAADGTLWLVRPKVDRIVVERSSDLGKTFSAPVTVRPSR